MAPPNRVESGTGDTDDGGGGGGGGVSSLKQRWEQRASVSSQPQPSRPNSLTPVARVSSSSNLAPPFASLAPRLRPPVSRNTSGVALARQASDTGVPSTLVRPVVPRQRSLSGPPLGGENEGPGEPKGDSEEGAAPERSLRTAHSQANLVSPRPAVAAGGAGLFPPPLPPSRRPSPSPAPRIVTAPVPTPPPSTPSSAEPTPPPLPPLATRPPPPPIPASRKPAPPAPTARKPVSASAFPLSPTEPHHIPSRPDAPSRPDSTSAASSVRALASRFSTPQPYSRPVSAPNTPPVTPPALWADPFDGAKNLEGVSVIGMDHGDPFDSVDAALGEAPRRNSAFDRPGPPTRRDSSSSAGSSRLPPVPPRPTIPPRLPATVAALVDLPSRPAPPPIPSRVGTSPPAPSVPFSPPELTSSPSPVPSPSPLPPLLPPPKKKTTLPIPTISRSASVARVPPKITTPRPTTSTSAPPSAPPPTITPYVPPPPPSRAIAPDERLAPQRPAIVSLSGDDSSSEDEDETAFNKSQEFPDATFANRRPPALRNRKPINAPSQFYSFAVRGKRVVTAGQHHVYVWHPSHFSGAAQAVPLPVGDHKVPAVEFCAAGADAPADDGRFVWGGTREGHLFEIDTLDLRVSALRQNIHSHSVSAIFRVGRSMVTLDESGKLFIWGSSTSAAAPQLTSTPKVQRVPEKQNFVAMVGNELWTASGPIVKAGVTGSLARSPQIRVFDPTGDGAWTVLARPLTLPDAAGPTIGSVTASAIVPSQPTLAFLGHDNGYVSVWNRETYACLAVQRVSPFGITTMVGVEKYLWAGFRTGFIYVYNVQAEPWTVHKAWKAHGEAVTKILVDPASLWTDGALQIASSGSDMVVQLWDGFLRDDWLDTELHLRQREYCTYRSIRALCVSWNVDAAKPQDLAGHVNNFDFLHQCLTSVESPDIISFGFQEMIDLESKKLTAKTLILGKKKATFSDTVSSSYRLWHDKLVQAVRLAMPPECPYTVINVGDMVGLFSCIFVKSAERERLRDVALITVKTGMKGRYGNKGAILSRFVIDDTSICFINCHLAAGQTHRRQRDHDLAQILEDKSAFSDLASSSPGAYAAGGAGTSVFDHELCILSGDLNYRIDLRREVVAKAVAEGQLEGLLAADQLLNGLAKNQTFRLRSFKEAPITFAPTYKYDPGTDDYDSSPKKRIPAWCDRVLWRADHADKVTPLHYQRYECNISDHKPISAALDLRVKSIVPEKRAALWHEVESAWFGVESQLLESARTFFVEAGELYTGA